jgi:uncharacterized protein (DUF1330 family)
MCSNKRSISTSETTRQGILLAVLSLTPIPAPRLERTIMSAYVVFVRDRITDPEEFRLYEEAAPAASIGRPVTPLAFYGSIDTLEGPPVDGAVILEYPSAAEARAFYDSTLYQEALQHRLKGADYRVFIVDGVGA